MDKDIIGKKVKVTVELVVDKVEFSKDSATISGWVETPSGKQFTILPYIESAIEKEIENGCY